MSVDCGVTELDWPFSNAHCCFAASMMRRLLIQAFVCEVWRAFTKFGIAIAANRPMMATTIMISTSVKPDLRVLLIAFIILTFFSVMRWNVTAGGLYDNIFVHLIACCNRVVMTLAPTMPRPKKVKTLTL